MDKPTLITDHQSGKLRWRVNFGGVLAAELNADVQGEHAILHNRIYLWSKELCREYREMFERVREQLKARGIVLIMVCSDHYTEKMGKYWKMMGFKIFYEVSNTHGGTIPCAVMEV